MIDGQGTTKFLRDWLRQYLELVGGDLRRTVGDKKALRGIFSLPEKLEVDDDGNISAGTATFSLKLLEFGSSELGVPSMKVVRSMSRALEDQAELEMEQKGMI